MWFSSRPIAADESVAISSVCSLMCKLKYFVLDILASHFDLFLQVFGEKSNRRFAEWIFRCLLQIRTHVAAVEE